MATVATAEAAASGPSQPQFSAMVMKKSKSTTAAAIGRAPLAAGEELWSHHCQQQVRMLADSAPATRVTKERTSPPIRLQYYLWMLSKMAIERGKKALYTYSPLNPSENRSQSFWELVYIWKWKAI